MFFSTNVGDQHFLTYFCGNEMNSTKATGYCHTHTIFYTNPILDF